MVGEQHGVDVITLAQIIEVFARIEIVDRTPRSRMPFEMLAIGEKTGHMVVAGVAQTRYEAHRLVAVAVDEHAAQRVLLLDALFQDVVDEDHRHAKKHQEEDRDGHVAEQNSDENRHCHVDGTGQPQEQAQQRILAENSQADRADVAQRRITDDGAVSPESHERQQRKERGAEHPQQHEPPAETMIGPQVAHQQHRQRRCDRRSHVAAQYQPRVEIAIRQKFSKKGIPVYHKIHIDVFCF